MSEFTKDCLRFCVRAGNDRPETFNIATANNPDANIASLAAFALALLERAENAEATVKDYLTVQAERDALSVQLSAWHSAFGATQLTHAKARLESVEAERDRLKAENQRLWNGSLITVDDSASMSDLRFEIDRLRKELEEAEDGIWVLLVAYSPEGHDAPRECFATGPLTGDPISDLVLCPACAAEKHSAVRRARERGGSGGEPRDK